MRFRRRYIRSVFIYGKHDGLYIYDLWDGKGVIYSYIEEDGIDLMVGVTTCVVYGDVDNIITYIRAIRGRFNGGLLLDNRVNIIVRVTYGYKSTCRGRRNGNSGGEGHLFRGLGGPFRFLLKGSPLCALML